MQKAAKTKAPHIFGIVNPPTIDDDGDTVFVVAALLVSDLNTKQQILESESIDQAVDLLNNHLNVFLEEE